MLGFIDPNSTGGKLFLLVVDKLFIGAILAGAFVIYDYWKTEEVRKYNQIIQTAQDNFKRAEFTKELLPIVLSQKENVSIRIEVLGSLIRTGSIEESSAFDIVLSLLREDKLVRGNNLLADTQLVASIVRAISPIIPSILPQILDAYGHYSNKNDAPPGYNEVLLKAFEYAWRNYSDDKLKILGDKNFVAKHLDKLMDITPQRNSQHEYWTDTSLLALIILRDIEIGRSARTETDTVVQAQSRLAEFLDPKSDDSESINLSVALFHALQNNDKTEFIESAFSVIERLDRIIEDSRGVLPEKRDPSHNQLAAAMHFVVQASATNSAAERLAMPIVREFYDFLRSDVDISFGKYPMQRTAVCVLVRSMSNVGHGNSRSSQADELLSHLSRLQKNKLRAANIGFLVDGWNNEEDERRAKTHCTN